MLQVRVLYRPSDLTLPNAGYARNPSLMVHAGQCARIRFEKNGGDLGPPAGFPRLRIQKYSAARGAPASGPSLVPLLSGIALFFRSLLRGRPNSTHGVTANAEISGISMALSFV